MRVRVLLEVFDDNDDLIAETNQSFLKMKYHHTVELQDALFNSVLDLGKKRVAAMAGAKSTADAVSFGAPVKASKRK